MANLKREFHPSEIPSKPGVYIYRDRFGTVIYVGKAVNLRRRMSSYFQPGRIARADAKLRSLIHSIHSWEFFCVKSEDEALILESRLIKDYAPYYNILMRDDKRYLLLKINLADRFPTLACARLKKNDGAEYFGPFPHGSALRATQEFLIAYFKLRGCKSDEPDAETRKRCLKRIVKDCCAPCAGNVTPEEYRAKVDAMLRLLRGDIRELREKLSEEMRDAAQNCRFEKAAKLRDILQNLDTVFGRKVRTFERTSLDVSPGESAILALQKELGLPQAPRHMICFDISNIMGTLAVASMVVFRDGKPSRSDYRRFRIKTVFQSDDFAMMAEVIRRHFSRLLEEKKPMPDLAVVDGGKGQLHAALKILREIGVPPFPIIGLAKREEEIFLPGRSEPVVLDHHNIALRVIQALRDEAHRFAITYHRELRNNRIEASLLDEIPGIGATRKLQLLRAFGSVRELRKKTPEEICEKVPSIGEALAEKLLYYLNRSQ